MSKAAIPAVLMVAFSATEMSYAQFTTWCSAVGTTAPTSPKYALPAVKSSADVVKQDGLDLEAAVKDADDKQAIADKAKTYRDALRQKANQHAGIYVKNVEAVCTTEAELKALALSGRKHPSKGALVALVVPVLITATPGKVKGSIIAHCKAIQGIRLYKAEISIDPVTAESWKALPGNYARRTIPGLVSGARYWIRFATTRGEAQSAWSDPVSAIAS